MKDNKWKDCAHILAETLYKASELIDNNSDMDDRIDTATNEYEGLYRKDNGLIEVDKHKKACIEIVDLINTAATRPKAIWTLKEAVLLAQRMGDVAIKSFEA